MIQAKLLFDSPSKDGGQSQIAPGIYTKGFTFFTGMNRDQSWWDINFADRDGHVIRKRLFDPKGNFPNEGESPEEALYREMEDNLKHVVKLARVILGDEATEQISAEDYQSFNRKVSELVASSKGTLVNLKVVVVKKKDKETGKDLFFSDLSRYPNYLEESGTTTKLKFSKREAEVLEEYENSKPVGEQSSDTAAQPSSSDLPF